MTTIERMRKYVLAEDDYNQAIERFNNLLSTHQWGLLADAEVRGYLERATKRVPVVLRDRRVRGDGDGGEER